jgi:hypothetical protein
MTVIGALSSFRKRGEMRPHKRPHRDLFPNCSAMQKYHNIENLGIEPIPCIGQSPIKRTIRTSEISLIPHKAISKL